MFEIILFGLVIVSGVIRVLGKKVIKAPAKYQHVNQVKYLADLEENEQPAYYELSHSLFPLFLTVFLLRSFIVEPFRIPSGSMLPTLEVGDFVLVNKYHYGVRLPILHKKVLDYRTPERGEVMVFRYPGDNKTNYIKRVIGLPGDVVEYEHDTLYINGVQITADYVEPYIPFSKSGEKRVLAKHQQLIPKSSEDEKHTVSILLEPYSATERHGIPLPDGKRFTVPAGHYFVLGDNRDHSADSRFWQFVPEENIVGEAIYIWFHWNWAAASDSWNKFKGINLSRVGSDI